jgi:Raf kinase inhibitor-like YbhB/YbcL family protein
MRAITICILGLCICLALAGCKGKEERPEKIVERRIETGEAEMAFRVMSPAFEDGSEIPGKYTCVGRDISPEIRWENAPDGTKSFALICDDPDAPGVTWIHWVVWAIPPDAGNLPEGTPRHPTLEDGTTQGITDFGKIGYGGPCPPGGKPHRYFFKLYALDNVTDLESGATKQQLLEAMEGHILAEAQLMGTFAR